MAKWPEAHKSDDEEIIQSTVLMRSVGEKALALRSTAGIKVRQPLASLTVSEVLFKNAEYAEILKDEINVKEIIIKAGEMKLDTVLTEDLKNEGKIRELIRAIQELRKNSGLSTGDSVLVELSVDKNFESVVNKFSAEIMSVVNAKDIKITEIKIIEDTLNPVGKASIEIDGMNVNMALYRA